MKIKLKMHLESQTFNCSKKTLLKQSWNARILWRTLILIAVCITPALSVWDEFKWKQCLWVECFDPGVERDPELSSVAVSLLMPLTVMRLLSQTAVWLQLQVDNDLITQVLDHWSMSLISNVLSVTLYIYRVGRYMLTGWTLICSAEITA